MVYLHFELDVSIQTLTESYERKRERRGEGPLFYHLPCVIKQ